MGKRYCEVCDDLREYRIDSRPDTYQIHGVKFDYIEQFATCAVCGAPIYVPEVNDANVDAMHDAYRQAADIITVDEIRRIMKKYDIAAEPLARILSFGKITIARYLSGDLPSRRQSGRLREIADSTEKMESALEAAKDAITPIAYQKCRAALDRLLSYERCSKVEAVAQYILRKLCDITPLALQKLLYYCQGFYTALHGAYLFDDDCQAWMYGPVYPEVYRRYKGFGYDPIDTPIMPFAHPQSRLTEDERQLIDVVAESFGRYSGDILREMTHKESPWIDARGDLPLNARSTQTIPKESIADYFSGVLRAYGIQTLVDISIYPRKMTQ